MNQIIRVNGLFEVTRTRPRRLVAAASRFILVCRGGRLFGADSEGHVCMGRLLAQRTHHTRLSAVRGTYEIPLRRVWSPKPSIRVPVVGIVDPFARSQNATINVGGRTIDVEIIYLGPLPP